MTVVQPQVMLINDQFFVEGDYQEAVHDFINRFRNWKNSNLHASSKDEETGAIEWTNFTDSGDKYIFQAQSSKPAFKGEIKIVSP